MESGSVKEALAQNRDWKKAERVLVLCYHNIVPDEASRAAIKSPELRSLSLTQKKFDQQLKFLKKTLNFVSPEQLFSPNSKSKLPARPTLITFDDGTQSQLNYALPILNKHGLKSLSFVALDHHKAPKPYWWDLADRSGLSLNPRELGYEEAYRIASANSQDLQPLFLPMSIDQLKLWVQDGQFLASHANEHSSPLLWKKQEEISQITNPQELKAIAGNNYSSALAFPFGHSLALQQEKAIYKTLASHGFTIAYGMQAGLSSLPTMPITPMEAPRLMVHSEWSLLRLSLKITRFFYFMPEIATK